MFWIKNNQCVFAKVFTFYTYWWSWLKLLRNVLTGITWQEYKKTEVWLQSFPYPACLPLNVTVNGLKRMQFGANTSYTTNWTIDYFANIQSRCDLSMNISTGLIQRAAAEQAELCWHLRRRQQPWHTYRFIHVLVSSWVNHREQLYSEQHVCDWH